MVKPATDLPDPPAGTFIDVDHLSYGFPINAHAGDIATIQFRIYTGDIPEAADPLNLMPVLGAPVPLPGFGTDGSGLDANDLSAEIYTQKIIASGNQFVILGYDFAPKTNPTDDSYKLKAANNDSYEANGVTSGVLTTGDGQESFFLPDEDPLISANILGFDPSEGDRIRIETEASPPTDEAGIQALGYGWVNTADVPIPELVGATPLGYDASVTYNDPNVNDTLIYLEQGGDTNYDPNTDITLYVLVDYTGLSYGDFEFVQPPVNPFA